MSSISATLKAIGLNVQPNFLDPQSVPPGSLFEASNVVIRRDNVIEPRRGYKLYGNPLGSLSDRASQLATYKFRILRYFSDSIEFDTQTLNTSGESIFQAFNGSHSPAKAGLRTKYIESNGNFYFTSSNGIQKISVSDADELGSANGSITSAGGIPALDVSATLVTQLGQTSGFLTQDSAVAYRIVWAYNDNNKNLILGSPSQRTTIFNSLSNLLLADFNNLLNQIDSACDYAVSLLSDGNYFDTLNLNSQSSASDLYANLIALAQKLDADILYADQVSVSPLQIAGCTINADDTIGTIALSSGNPTNYIQSGSKITLSGFAPQVGTLDTIQTVTTTFPTFSTTGTTTTGTAQVSTITTVADASGSLEGVYWTINSAKDLTQYYVWYNVTGVGVNPNISGKTGIQVNIATNDSANTVASKTAAAITAFTTDFTNSVSSNVITITNNAVGPSAAVSGGTSGFTATDVVGISPNIITSVASTTGINIGSLITGTGIPSNTFVTNVGIGTITISNPATASGSGVALSFGSGINFSIIIGGISSTVNQNTTINTNAATPSGPVTVSNATIYSGEYESITQPTRPLSPATDQDLVNLQIYLQSIITQLQSEPSTGTPPVINATAQSTFISPITLTTSANVNVTFTIPQNITSNYFYQVYRSKVTTATGVQILSTDVSPNDELQLVFEGFPTADQLAAGSVTVLDITPDSFAGAYLYTNATTGEGINQANTPPPFALDINYFKQCVFYANTSTNYLTSLSLLGVLNMIAEVGSGTTPKITITNGTITNTYSFVIGVEQIITVTTVADVSGNLAGKYFKFYSADNQTTYYAWYNVSGSGADPAIAGATGIRINLVTNDSANNVAAKTSNAIGSYLTDFTSSVSANVITITNNNEGLTNSPTANTSGFTVAVATSGAGEDAANKKILLSSSVSPAQAIDATARSMVHVINTNVSESVYLYYLSDAQSVPGSIEIESRNLAGDPFYIIANNSITGASFNPDISPDSLITSITAAGPTVITTASTHGLLNGNQIIIGGSNSTPSINGKYTITYISPTTFSIPVTVTVSGNTGGLSLTSSTLFGDNQVKPNRVYYSKVLQPEAVPSLNFLDVGAQDKPILRIFPIRDSLFVYKQDGLYRISGETAPFNLALFDSSIVAIAPDSIALANNLIYGWCTQGIFSTSESGVSIVSRPIDIDILKLATAQYTNFATATWGIGYDSDNSYTVYTIQETSDTVATIGYRYSNLTNTWTTFDKTNTCGVINDFDDTQYLGAGDVNSIEQERKNFNRLDYQDREFVQTLVLGNFFGSQMQLADVSNVVPGDVIGQEAFITPYLFNTFLQKLDNDLFLSPHTYHANNLLISGGDARASLDAVLLQIANDAGRTSKSGFSPASDYTKLRSITSSIPISGISAANPTVVTTTSAHGLQTGRNISITGTNSTPSANGVYSVVVLSPTTFSIPINISIAGTSGTVSVNNESFADIQTSYNLMIDTLNNDNGVAYNNYAEINYTTLIESQVLSVNLSTKRVTLELPLEFIVGPLTIYKAIISTFQYTPATFNDPLNSKHVREFTMMFEAKTFSDAEINFSSDLIPAFIRVPFKGTGNGIFGYNNFGYNFFGGGSFGAPFRSYVPRLIQRCRYINCQFTHSIARESYACLGITLVGETVSTRAYR